MCNIKLFYDLHIHSVLSPCADELMTPNNILNMSMLKEVEILAVTDHNSTKQLKVFQELEDSYDFIFIPGVEVTVLEDFDVLCYFKTFSDAFLFDNYLESHLNGSWGPYNESNQVLTDIYDTITATFNKPLTGTNIHYKDLVKKVRDLHGAIVLAHINRPSSSALKSFQLSEIEFDAIEIQKYGREDFLNDHPELEKYKIFYNSDSHTLMSISEKEDFIELEEKSLSAFFNYLLGDSSE